MSLGSFVRRLFGSYEHRIAAVYRAIYIDMDALIECFLRWQPSATRILEVGCGEGAVTERLNSAYGGATITAIDITPRVGRLYRGPRERVRFVQCAVQKIAVSEPARYDLVILSDVMHHVPVELRQGLLDSIRAALAPGGLFIFKEWERNIAPIHWLAYASDRWLTGDRIHYMARDEMHERLMRSFGADALVAEARIGPWWNNLAMLVRREATGPA
ncbi:MAG: class I SAM-dependent methyltransferase [Steroidobacterales bacterium]